MCMCVHTCMRVYVCACVGVHKRVCCLYAFSICVCVSTHSMARGKRVQNAATHPHLQAKKKLANQNAGQDGTLIDHACLCPGQNESP